MRRTPEGTEPQLRQRSQLQRPGTLGATHPKKEPCGPGQEGDLSVHKERRGREHRLPHRQLSAWQQSGGIERSFDDKVRGIWGT